MSRRRIAQIGTAFAVVVLGIVMIAAARGWDETELPLTEVKSGKFKRQVTAEGNLKATKATPLTTPVEAQGPLKFAWIAPDGSAVKAGEVVFRFDPTDFEKLLYDGRVDHQTSDNKITK